VRPCGPDSSCESAVASKPLWLVQLVQRLDGLAVRLERVHDFGRVEAESLKRLMGGQLPLVLDGSIAEVIRQLYR